jgi:hypothetical protein
MTRADRVPEPASTLLKRMDADTRQHNQGLSPPTLRIKQNHPALLSLSRYVWNLDSQHAYLEEKWYPNGHAVP